MLKDMRKRRKLTVKALSERAAVPFRTIQGWELQGKGQRTLRTAKRLADALGCSIEDLIDD